MPPETVRLRSPHGSTVAVPEDKAERLISFMGYQPIEEEKKRTSRPRKADAKPEQD